MKGQAALAALLLVSAAYVAAKTDVKEVEQLAQGANMQNLAGKCIKFRPQKAGTYSFEVGESLDCPAPCPAIDHLHCLAAYIERRLLVVPRCGERRRALQHYR